jgi:Raf kinase inhibitor-like YbhB/YbcL family protein
VDSPFGLFDAQEADSFLRPDLRFIGTAQSGPPETAEVTSMATGSFMLSSPVFDEGGLITCSGADQSPPLAWSGAPGGTASFALVVDDPDASGFIHWLAYNLPGDSTSLAENAAQTGSLAQGRDSFGSVGWRGPCPPSGVHRYTFTIFALDASLSLADPPSAAEVRAALRDHVLGQAALNGRFGR